MTPRDWAPSADQPIMRKYLSGRRRAECEHPDTVSTVFAGIERVVCEDCGHASFAHHHDLVTEGASRLDVPHTPVGQA